MMVWNRHHGHHWSPKFQHCCSSHAVNDGRRQRRCAVLCVRRMMCFRLI